MTGRTCSIDGCEREHAARGWCLMHYKRWRKHGDPTIVLNPIGAPLAERWMAKVDAPHPASCWWWTGSTDGRGYGMFHVGRRTAGVTTHIVRAHRWGYEHLVGPIPENHELDHLCRNPPCVNPAHLEPVTSEENIRRSPLFGRMRCARGHNNWATYKTQRTCRTCANAGQRRRRRATP
jgi:hypothetical protein